MTKRKLLAHLEQVRRGRKPGQLGRMPTPKGDPDADALRISENARKVAWYWKRRRADPTWRKPR